MFIRFFLFLSLQFVFFAPAFINAQETEVVEINEEDCRACLKEIAEDGFSSVNVFCEVEEGVFECIRSNETCPLTTLQYEFECTNFDDLVDIVDDIVGLAKTTVIVISVLTIVCCLAIIGGIVACICCCVNSGRQPAVYQQQYPQTTNTEPTVATTATMVLPGTIHKPPAADDATIVVPGTTTSTAVTGLDKTG